MIITDRFILRPLARTDASYAYLSWFEDDYVQKFIVGSQNNLNLEALRSYIKTQNEKSDVIFLGIFSKDEVTHIGNVKFDPVNSISGYATVGILIGDPAWRGRGVAREILEETAKWLFAKRSISKILLTVDRANVPAINAYLKAGFVEVNPPDLEFDLPTNCLLMAKSNLHT